MLNIIKERTPEVFTNYCIEYFYKDDPTGGFCFPANPDRTPAFDKMAPEMKANYDKCQTADNLVGPVFTIDTHTYVHPAVGKCSCGTEVVLECDYMGAVRCECGRWYNLFGQSLKDPKYWEEEW